jgi:hypothetical protein
MDALPALTTIANDAVRRQFATTTAPVSPEPTPTRSSTFRARLALAALLERAAQAIAPARYRPAH